MAQSIARERQDGNTYRPKVALQTVAVIAGSSASVTVEYEAQFGQVQIGVRGLPSGEQAEIRFYEDGFPGSYLSINQPLTIDSVAEGQYVVQTFEIEAADGTVYRPEHYYQSVSVKGNELSLVDVIYFPKFGSISFVINGLPAGLSADVTLETDALDYGITESIVIDSLEAGDYTVTAAEVTATNGDSYKPDFETTIVTVDGDNFSKTLTRTTTLDSLLKGNYRITAEDVPGLDGLTYKPGE